MESLKISPPEELLHFARERVAAGGHPTIDSYIQSLIKFDECRIEREEIGQLLLEGLRSGEPITADEESRDGRKRRMESLAAKADHS